MVTQTSIEMGVWWWLPGDWGHHNTEAGRPGGGYWSHPTVKCPEYKLSFGYLLFTKCLSTMELFFKDLACMLAYSAAGACMQKKGAKTCKKEQKCEEKTQQNCAKMSGKS